MTWKPYELRLDGLVLDDAIADMENYADFFREKELGSIRKVTISLSDNPSQGTVSVYSETVVRK